MNVTIHILDEVNIQIEGLASYHTQEFFDKYAILSANRFYSVKYKLGTWDGRISFFKKNGLTYFALLPEILPILKRMGYKIKLDDRRRLPSFYPTQIDNSYFSKFNDPDTDEPIILFEHQVRTANKLLDAGSGMIIAATGAGKSYICAAIAQQYNIQKARVLVIVPSQDLVLQTRQDFINVGVNCGEYSGDIKDYKGYPTVMSTWQALQNNPTVIQEFDVIIVDECHGVKGEVLQKLLNEYGKNIVHKFGVTGTLPKDPLDAMAVKVTLGVVHGIVTAKELIDAGVLAKLDIHIEQLDEPFKDKYHQYVEEFKEVYPNKKPKSYSVFKDEYFPDYTAEKAYLVKTPARRAYLVKRLTELKEQGNTFAMVSDVAFGKKIASEIPGAIFVYGQDKKKVRKQIYSLFKENDNLLVIANVQIASTGLNIKRIYHLVLIDIGKSYTRVIQAIGRGLRKAIDKDHVDVWDFCSDLGGSKRHLSLRTSYYKEAQYPFSKQIIEYIYLVDVDLNN